MFNNIGRKIKGLAKFIFWVISIISVIAGILVIVQSLGRSGRDSSGMIYTILSGVGIAVGGVILAWLQNFLLYGFGELVDSNQRILQVLEHQNVRRDIETTTNE